MRTRFDRHRYDMGFALKEALSPEQKAYMEDLDKFFVRHNALAAAVEGLHGASRGNLLSCLSIISNATLGWHKPFERIAIHEFQSTRAGGSVLTLDMSRRTVHRALSALMDAGLVVRFTSPCGRVIHYGLNVSRILSRIQAAYARIRGTSRLTVMQKEIWQRLSSSPLLRTLQEFMAHFAGRVIHGLAEVRTILREGGRVMTSLAGSLRAAKKRAEEVSRQKSQARAAQSFFNDNGSPNPAAALEYWHRTVKDSERYGRMYQGKRTGKLIGMMKHWLREAAQSGRSDEEIRSMIRDIVERWGHVEDRERTVTALSAKGKAYEVRMPLLPDFEFFFTHRVSVAAVLDRVVPAEAASRRGLANAF